MSIILQNNFPNKIDEIPSLNSYLTQESQDYAHNSRTRASSLPTNLNRKQYDQQDKHNSNQDDLKFTSSKKLTSQPFDGRQGVESDNGALTVPSVELENPESLKPYDGDLLNLKTDETRSETQQGEQTPESVALNIALITQESYNDNENLLNQENNLNQIELINTTNTPQPDIQIHELNAKISLNKVLGLCIAATLGSTLLLLSVYQDFSYQGIWLVVFVYLGSVVISDFKLHKKVWLENNEYTIGTFDALSALISMILIYIKTLGITSSCLYSILPFCVNLIAHIIFFRSSLKVKIWSFLAKCFYIVQTLFIALKVDESVEWRWENVLSLSWVFLATLMFYQARRVKSIAKKTIPMPIYEISQNQGREVLIKMIGFIWHLVYNCQALGACLILFGITKANSVAQDFEWLTAASIIVLIFNVVLVAYTVLVRKHLVTFLVAASLPEDYYENTMNRKSGRKIEFETEKIESYFTMVSSTYFVPLESNENNNIKAAGPLTGEMDSCYICCRNSPDAILLTCGHGGICYDCAISSIKKKDQCCECRKNVEKICKLDVTSRLYNTVKGIEVTKVIVTEA